MNLTTLKPKPLKDLTLLDKFLFDETMENSDVYEDVLQIILEDDHLRLLTEPETEKELRTVPWLRSIRMDVFALDQEKTVYNTEMQAEKKLDLVRRSRYYQGLIDSSLLPSGITSYNSLNNSCIIMITPFDLFDRKRYRYTFIPCCKEDKTLELNDGAMRIFLNTKGTNDHEISPELRDFLHYVGSLDESLVENSNSERLKNIHACVNRIKASEEMGVKYMQKWEERVLDREKGREEGREEGRLSTTLENLRNLMTNVGMTPEQAMAALSVPHDEQEKYLKLLQ